jgi:hypothetical protein
MGQQGMKPRYDEQACAANKIGHICSAIAVELGSFRHSPPIFDA